MDAGPGPALAAIRAASAGHRDRGAATLIAQPSWPALAQAVQKKAAPAVGLPLARAKSWGYQLRGIDPAKIAASAYDVVVIDFAQEGRPFTAAEVEVMRTKPDGGRRHVLGLSLDR